MKIWKLGCEVDNFRGFHLKDENDLECINLNLDQGNIVSKWKIIELIGYNNNKETGDNPKFWPYSNIIVVSEEAKKLIDMRFGKYIQFLPVVDTDYGKTFFMCNIINILNGIDYDKSEFKKLLGTHDIDVIEYVFKEDVKHIPIFKLYLHSHVMTPYVFVNDEFKNLIDRSGLKGFKFNEVYDFKQ